MPYGVAVDRSGNVYVADTGNHTVRKISPSGVVTTLSKAGVSGSTDGTNSVARFNSPECIAVDSAGILYVSDTGNRTIRQVTVTGNVSTIGGTPGTIGTEDGTGSSALFGSPKGIAMSGNGELFVVDYFESPYRKGGKDSRPRDCNRHDAAHW